jgi:hypothetical protein
MTLKIENIPSPYTAVLTYMEKGSVSPDGAQITPDAPSSGPPMELPPGESTVVTLWDTRYLVITEKKP